MDEEERVLYLLNFNGNKGIQLKEEGVVKLMELVKDKQVEEIYLQGNDIKDSGLAHLLNSLQNLPTIKKIGVEENSLGGEGGNLMADFLFKNKTVECLDVSKNSEMRGWEKIGKALQENETLTEFSMSNNRMPQEEMRLFLCYLAEKCHLKKLNLFLCRFKEESASKLVELISTSNTIEGIDLYACEMSSEQLIKIFESLRKNEILTELNVGGNQFSKGAVKALSQVLKENKTLSSLSLLSTKFKEEECDVLVDAVGENQFLSSFCLGSCEMSDQVSEKLFEKLKTNSSIKELILSSNEISENGANKLAELLKVSRTIEYVDISNNKIGEDGLRSIVNSVERSQPQLRYVRFSENSCEEKIGKELKERAEKVFEERSRSKKASL